MSQMTVKAEIICVGTELLLGQIVNTNAAWLAAELSQAGVFVYFQTVVGDNSERIKETIRRAIDRSELVFMTGGLGPTQDDMTMACAADAASLPLQLHQPSRDAIAEYFRRTGRTKISENNWKQAYLPDPCIVLPNYNGTAPGCIMKAAKKTGTCHIILLPGPPSEMKPMFLESLQPWLESRIKTKLRHVYVRMTGIGESAAETLLHDLIERQDNPTIAPYASIGEVVFRITQAFSSPDEMDRIAPVLAEIRRLAGSYIYEIGDRRLPEVVFDLLLDAKQTVSFAESCTGGLAAKQLTDYPGASSIFKGSLVAYANRIKTTFLGVDEAILEKSGAVSKECAVAMASGCRERFMSDWSVAITGIAGPGGGSVDKPVGTVFIAVAGPDVLVCEKYAFAENRERIRTLATINAFNLLRRSLHEPAT